MNALLNGLGLNAEQLRQRKGALGGSDANTIMGGDEAKRQIRDASAALAKARGEQVPA